MKKREKNIRKSQRTCDDRDRPCVPHPESSTKSKSKELCVEKGKMKSERMPIRIPSDQEYQPAWIFRRLKDECAGRRFPGHVRVVFSLFKLFFFVRFLVSQ